MNPVPFIAAALVAASVPGAAGGGGFLSAQVELLRSDAQEIVLRARFPRPQALPGGDGASEDLTVPGLPRTRTVGEPSLPFRPVLVAVPPGAGWTLQIESPAETRWRGVPAGFPAPPPGAQPIATDPPRQAPAAPVEVEFDGYLRDRRVLRIVFHPLIPDPGGEGSAFHPVLTARLVLTGATRDVFALPELREAAPSVHDSLYRRVLLNEGTIDPVAYRRSLHEAGMLQDGGHESAGELALLGSGGPAAHIEVQREGLWSVTHAQLLAAGVDGTGTPVGSISLRAGGVDVPLRVIDGGDGLFGPGDRIEFYGTGVPFNPSYDRNVYRLAFNESPGLMVATRAAVPAGGASPGSFLHTARFEINERLFTTAKDGEGDYIGWERLTAPSSGSPPTVRNFPEPLAGEPVGLISLSGLDPGAVTVRVRARVYHLAGTSHVTNLVLNGVNLLDSHPWSGVDFTHDVVTSAANLMPANTVTLELSGPSFNQVLMNWIEIEYDRLFAASSDELVFTSSLAAPVAHQVTGFSTSSIEVYDVTAPGAPVRLTGTVIGGGPGNYSVTFTDTLGGSRRFVARAGTASPGGDIRADLPSNLQDPGNGADLIILAYREFVDEMVPLAAARAAQGMRVALVDLDDVYDEFAFGRSDPAAIRSFVAAAYANWQPPAPSFLLLVGNATLDPKQQLSGSVPLQMPSGLFQAPSLGMASTDNYFVTVAGSDPLPELYAGRIPAQTEAEAADAVARILAYDGIDPGLFPEGVLLVADNDLIQFETIQEDMVSLHLSGTRIPVERAYLRLLGTAATNQKIRDTINLGAVMASFIGHGNIHNWASENIFLDTTDVPLLTNADRPVFLATMNCINGLHAGPRAPNISSLAEQVLMSPAGGAVGVWSPTALGTLVDYQTLSDVLFRTLFTDRVQALGAATTSAKIEAYVNDGISSANLEEMTLFGDPTVVLRVDGDGDGLTDSEEDGCACGLEARDADTDDDGLLDGAEAGGDADGDGAADFLDPDADEDGLPDGLEAGVLSADPDTDLSAGFFLADTDPLSTTDPFTADSDGGGAADGAEDRDRDGAVSIGETDPENPADDPACGPAPLPELANLLVDAAGPDLLLTWDDASGVDPCVLYRILEADPGGTIAPPALPPFTSRGVTTLPAATLAGEAAVPAIRWYLVVATRPDLGDGPTGH